LTHDLPPCDALSRRAEATPWQAALFDGYWHWTFRALSDDADRVAANLWARGARPGDRLALPVQRDVFSVVLLAGCLRLGATVLPLNPVLPAVAAARAMAGAGCRWILAAAGPRGVRRAVPGALLDDTPDPSVFDEYARLREPGRGALAVMTSGSTGEPKAALLPADRFTFNAERANARIPFRKLHRWLLSLPLHHVSGLAVLFRSWVGGGMVAVPGEGEALEDALPLLAITHVSLVPVQLRRLLSTEPGRESLTHLRVILLGGGPIPDDLLEEAVAIGLPVAITYGMTETASQVATTDPKHPEGALRRAAPPLDPDLVRIAPDGEIEVRGGWLFEGYLQGEAISRPFSDEGWFATGDVGACDPDGWIRVLGRRDNRFFSGGENVYPEEIERVLAGLPGVAHAVVVPVAHPEYGQRPVGFVRMQDGQWSAKTRQTLLDAMRERLPGFKTPDDLFPWPDAEPWEGVKPRRANFAKLAARLIADFRE
jgi:o-succinylbenzoate---CoA ligase